MVVILVVPTAGISRAQSSPTESLLAKRLVKLGKNMLMPEERVVA